MNASRPTLSPWTYCLLAGVLIMPAAADADDKRPPAGRTRVLHEPPPGGGQPARSDRVVPAGGGHQDRLPAAIDTNAGRIERPAEPTPNAPPPPMYGASAAPGAPPDRVRPDRRTGGERDLRYGVVFNPSVMPFKRDRVFDRIAADGAFESSGVGRRQLQARGAAARPGHELFWGRLSLDLVANKPTPLPSVAGESALIRWQSSPPMPMTFFRDRAGNWSVVSKRSGGAMLRILVDAPSAYFAAPLSPGQATDDPWKPALPASLQARMRALWPALDVHPRRQDRRHNIRQLTAWYRGFEAGEIAAGRAENVLADLTVARRGVCRHRSMAFVAMAHSLGIPAHYVVNDAHAFVEAWVIGNDGRGGWQRIDLGGSAETLRLESADNKHLHRPLYNDPLPRPESYAGAITQVKDSAGLDATSWAGAKSIHGANKMVGAVSGTGAGEPGPPRANPAGKPDPGSAAARRKSPQGRAWLRRRARAVAARRSPPPPGGAPSKPRADDDRTPTVVKLNRQDRLAYVGETLSVRGTLLARGAGKLAALPIEIWLVDAREPTKGIQLGTAMTDARGRFEMAVHIPLQSKLGLHDLVARFPGTTRMAPGYSTER